MTTNTKIVNAAKTANDAYLNGYGKISSFIRDLSTSKASLEDIEESINQAVEGLDEEQIKRLDKAYQMASSRILGKDRTIGLGWNKLEEKGFFRVPEKRERKAKVSNASEETTDINGGKDPFYVAVARFHAQRTAENAAEVARIMASMIEGDLT